MNKYYRGTYLLLIVTFCLAIFVHGEEPEVRKKENVREEILLRIFNWHKNAPPVTYRGEPVDWELFKGNPEDSIITNPGFETDQGWELSKRAIYTSSVYKNGNRALSIDGFGSALSHEIKTRPNGIYELSFWFKSDPSELCMKSRAFVRVTFLRNGKALKGNSYYALPSQGISILYDSKNGRDWVLYEEPFQVPLNCESCRIEVTSGREMKVYFDDIILKPYRKAVYIGEGSLSNPLLVKPGEKTVHDYKIRCFNLDGPPARIKSWQASIAGKKVNIVNVNYNDLLDYYTISVEIPALPEGKYFSRITGRGGAFTAWGQIMAKHIGDTFLIGIITDQHYLHSYHGTSLRYAELMNEVIRSLNIHNPDLVFLPGDYDEDFQPPAYFIKELQSLKAPVFIGRGNHEYDANNNLKLDKYFSQDRHYFNRILGDYHFIVIAGNELSPDGMHRYTLMTESQLEWIKSKLEENKDKTTIIFTEPSVCFQTSEGGSFTSAVQATELRALFEKHHVAAVIQGDKHRYYKEEIRGVTYITIPSPTRPFHQFPYAGYGLLLMQRGNIKYLDAVEFCHQKEGDPHPPEYWDLVQNYKHYDKDHHIPDNYYSEKVLHLALEPGGLNVRAAGNFNPYIGLPFRIDPKRYTGPKSVITGSNGEKYILIDLK